MKPVRSCGTRRAAHKHAAFQSLLRDSAVVIGHFEDIASGRRSDMNSHELADI